VFTPFATGSGGTFSGKWDATEGNNTTLLLLATAQYPCRPRRTSFHGTTQFTGGEIRGAIAAVPEPTSLLLLGAGGLG
jgi:hypothetical protein